MSIEPIGVFQILKHHETYFTCNLLNLGNNFQGKGLVSNISKHCNDPVSFFILYSSSIFSNLINYILEMQTFDYNTAKHLKK